MFIAKNSVCILGHSVCRPVDTLIKLLMTSRHISKIVHTRRFHNCRFDGPLPQIEMVLKVVRNKKIESFLLPNMIEYFETNRMSHSSPFYDDFFQRFHNCRFDGPLPQIEMVLKVVRNKKIESFLLPNMIEYFETNRMSHSSPFYDDFFQQKFNFKD